MLSQIASTRPMRSSTGQRKDFGYEIAFHEVSRFRARAASEKWWLAETSVRESTVQSAANCARRLENYSLASGPIIACGERSERERLRISRIPLHPLRRTHYDQPQAPRCTRQRAQRMIRACACVINQP